MDRLADYNIDEPGVHSFRGISVSVGDRLQHEQRHEDRGDPHTQRVLHALPISSNDSYCLFFLQLCALFFECLNVLMVFNVVVFY